MNLTFLIIAIILLMPFAWYKPKIAVLTSVFLLYMNIPVIGKKFFGVPEFLAGSVVVLLLLPQLIHTMLRREKLIVDDVFGLMCIFLAVLFASSFAAKDVSVAWGWIFVYLTEGLVLYFLVFNAIRDMEMLRRTIWVLLLAGSLQGSLSLYQDVTRSVDNTFYGFAQREVEVEELDLSTVAKSTFEREKIGGKDRASGPIGETNRYAQILIMILPFAVLLILGRASSRMTKLLAAGAAMLILSGILLTFSRGGFLTLVLMLMLLIFLREIRPHQAIGVVSVIVLLMVFAAPGFFSRVDTLRGVQALFSDTAPVRADGATRGRTVEMLAAFNVFLDHPLLGVGPGQYVPFYSEKYHLNQDNALRHIPRPRRAHSLYAELAAETGLIGSIVFMWIAAVVINRLWRLRLQAQRSHPEIASLSTAFLFCMFGYLVNAIFLHFAFQRYYWFLLAMTSAAIHIFQTELQSRRYSPPLASNEVKPQLPAST